MLKSGLSSFGSWVIPMLEVLRERGRMNPQRVSKLDSVWNDGSADENARLAVIAEALMAIMGRIDFVHQVFASTPWEKTLGERRLESIRTEAKGTRSVFDIYARKRWEEYLTEYPEDPRALTDFASFLANCPRRSMRDAPRALRIANRLLEVARERGDIAAELAALEISAAAHFTAGDISKAVEFQEKAWWKCPKEDTALRGRLEAKLQEYKKAQ
ncbi:MAG: tetratricopeptide repeat protein [Planctomycetota bacterium]